MKRERQHNEAHWAKFRVYIEDCRRVQLPTEHPNRLIHFTCPPMNDELFEYRYEQRADEYWLRSWHNGTERSHRGFTANMPEWLAAILATARVAGAIRPIKEPPPEVILWFRTDDKHHLHEFIEMT